MQAQSGTHGIRLMELAMGNLPHPRPAILPAGLVDGAASQTAAAGGVRDVPQAAKVSGIEGTHDWQGGTHRPFPPFESRGASPAVDQAFPHAPEVRLEPSPPPTPCMLKENYVVSRVFQVFS